MAKKTKQRKAAQQAAREARRLTPGKLFRLVLKSLLFAVIVSLVLMLLAAFGVPVLENGWLQVLVMLGVYLVALPFIMREFRPSHYLEKPPSR